MSIMFDCVNRVYVASPLSGATTEEIAHNMRRAKYLESVVSLYFYDRGYSVKAIAPHAYLPEFLDDNVPEERAVSINFGMEMLKTCDAIAVFCSHKEPKITNGMAQEILSSVKAGKIIFCFSEKEKEIVSSFLKEKGHDLSNIIILLCD